ncbi:NAD-dependent epimerase/dehydratase family protein [Streptomyces sp. SLBN-31]|uniref:NAD-dependent epimerase/dehydratase family protein n=1 Tax=Streptomyces sp. SLBN-31 TaxID=2768444 RepID=UPI0021B20610|nr:NAD-dependent epimerase/dehydratase family protein [Streptomyces sp. SLBN-31]
MSTEQVAASPAARGRVLVTGGTGFVGGHSVARLIAEGYRARVTVREPGQEAQVLAALRQAEVEPAGRLEFAVADLGADRGWAEAMDGVDHVLHHASPFPLTPPRRRTKSSSRPATVRCASSPRLGRRASRGW